MNNRSFGIFCQDIAVIERMLHYRSGCSDNPVKSTASPKSDFIATLPFTGIHVRIIIIITAKRIHVCTTLFKHSPNISEADYTFGKIISVVIDIICDRIKHSDPITLDFRIMFECPSGSWGGCTTESLLPHPAF
jgi:hypothetical protein